MNLSVQGQGGGKILDVAGKGGGDLKIRQFSRHRHVYRPYPEPTANKPMPDFYIIAETPRRFRRFERIEIDNLKIEIIL